MENWHGSMFVYGLDFICFIHFSAFRSGLVYVVEKFVRRKACSLPEYAIQYLTMHGSFLCILWFYDSLLRTCTRAGSRGSSNLWLVLSFTYQVVVSENW